MLDKELIYRSELATDIISHHNITPPGVAQHCNVLLSTNLYPQVLDSVVLYKGRVDRNQISLGLGIESVCRRPCGIDRIGSGLLLPSFRSVSGRAGRRKKTF